MPIDTGFEIQGNCGNKVAAVNEAAGNETADAPKEIVVKTDRENHDLDADTDYDEEASKDNAMELIVDQLASVAATVIKKFVSYNDIDLEDAHDQYFNEVTNHLGLA